MNSVPNAIVLTPATLQQLCEKRVVHLLSEELPELVGMIRVRGILADLGKAQGRWHYGVRLSDAGSQVAVDVPAGLVTGLKLSAGAHVEVTGVMRVRTSRYGGMELRLEAGEIVRDQRQAGQMLPKGAQVTAADMLRSLPAVRYPFPMPNNRPIDIAVVHSSAAQAQVVHDCTAELERLGRLARVYLHRVNILDPAEIAAVLDGLQADVVMIIRGGGNLADFEVFDDYRVLAAAASCKSYRVAGLGHSGNKTLLDHVVDHAARTPAQAGAHVRECVEGKIREWKAIREAAILSVQAGSTSGRQEVSLTTPTWRWHYILLAVSLLVAALIAIFR